MKKLLILACLLISVHCMAQVKLDNVLNSVNNTLGNNNLGKGLSNQDIINGLKEALTTGSKKASDQAAKTDGFYKNSLIKIPFPSEARDMKTTLVNLGMKRQVDDFEKQLNRAAEDASKKAATIFLNAISKITINDGLSILQGKQDEATQFLKKNTSNDLNKEFKPIIASSLKKVQITKYWNPLFTSYNKVPFVKRVNPNLEDYVAQKAIEGLFKLVAIEESKIRQDPAARVNDILKKVFGGK